MSIVTKKINKNI